MYRTSQRYYRYQRTRLQLLVAFIKMHIWPEWMNSLRTRGIFLVALGALGLAYAVKTSSLATSGYTIHALEKQLAALERENQELQTQLAAAQSLGAIVKRLPEVKMVSARAVTFISTPLPAVVAER